MFVNSFDSIIILYTRIFTFHMYVILLHKKAVDCKLKPTAWL